MVIRLLPMKKSPSTRTRAKSYEGFGVLKLKDFNFDAVDGVSSQLLVVAP